MCISLSFVPRKNLQDFTEQYVVLLFMINRLNINQKKIMEKESRIKTNEKAKFSKRRKIARPKRTLYEMNMNFIIAHTANTNAKIYNCCNIVVVCGGCDAI